jgi:hypothetical protein
LRTILQHAWAEIEHNLRYKLPSGEHQDEHFKAVDRRQWAMMAALLESVDERFVDRKKLLARPEQQPNDDRGDFQNAEKVDPPDDAFPWNGEKYWYVIEHRQGDAAITIQPKYEFFNLDQRIQDVGGPTNYKRSLLSGYKSNRFNWLAESGKLSWESDG